MTIPATMPPLRDAILPSAIPAALPLLDGEGLEPGDAVPEAEAAGPTAEGTGPSDETGSMGEETLTATVAAAT